MCYDRHVFVVLEELKGCYELRGSWVLDLNAAQQHIIRPLTECTSCRACEVSTRANANPFHVRATCQTNPFADLAEGGSRNLT